MVGHKDKSKTILISWFHCLEFPWVWLWLNKQAKSIPSGNGNGSILGRSFARSFDNHAWFSHMRGIPKWHFLLFLQHWGNSDHMLFLCLIFNQPLVSIFNVHEHVSISSLPMWKVNHGDTLSCSFFFLYVCVILPTIPTCHNGNHFQMPRIQLDEGNFSCGLGKAIMGHYLTLNGLAFLK